MTPDAYSLGSRTAEPLSFFLSVRPVFSILNQPVCSLPSTWGLQAQAV